MGHLIFQNITDKIRDIAMVSCAFLEADLDMRTKDDRGLALKLKHTRKSKKRSPTILLAHAPLWR